MTDFNHHNDGLDRNEQISLRLSFSVFLHQDPCDVGSEPASGGLPSVRKL